MSNSGFFGLASTLMVTVIGDSSLNGIANLPPRGPITYPDGPSGDPQLGQVLEGAALEAAETKEGHYKSLLFWLGNSTLASKYGDTFPVGGLTPVETEIWARQVGVLDLVVMRIIELIPALAPPVPPLKDPNLPQGLRAPTKTVAELEAEKRLADAQAAYAALTPDQRRKLLADVAKG